jgi:hypothetical protein
MTFISLGFLAAALAAGIPVLLHMIQRQRAKDLPFPTLRFLQISVEKTRRRRRIHDLFLLLLRMAVLILIALGLAEPTLTNLSQFWGGGSSAVVIIVDNSASMGVQDSGRPRFETALGAADQILDQLEAGDQVALFLPCGPSFPEEGRLTRSPERLRELIDADTEDDTKTSDAELSEEELLALGAESQAQARQLLDQVHVSYERADLAAQVDEARRLLQKTRAANKQIYVISDMQSVAWDGLPAPKKGARADEPPPIDPNLSEDERKVIEEMREIPIVMVDCHRAPEPNVALTNIQIRAAAPIAGVPLSGVVEIYNASDSPQQRLIELVIDGEVVFTSETIELDASKLESEDFQFSIKEGGLHRCEVRLLGEDSSSLDDRRFFSMQVGQGVPIAIVRERNHEIDYLNDSYYVECALTPSGSQGWGIQPTILTADQLLGEPLNKYAVMICVNLTAPTQETAERLAEYVRRGGHLIWFLGENVDASSYNEMNQSVNGGLFPAPLIARRTPERGGLRDSWNISYLDQSHPALLQLVDPPSMYQSVLVYEHITMDVAAAPNAWVLARLDDDEPLMTQQSIEKGSVMMIGTSAHVGWTNLPIRNMFLPFMARLTFNLAGVEQGRRQLTAGMPLVVPFDDGFQPGGMEILPPRGGSIRRSLGSDDEEGEATQRPTSFVYEDTHEIGIYAMSPLETADPKTIAFAVNPDADETDPVKMDLGDLELSYAGSPLVFAEDPEDLSGTFDWLREGRSLWEFFLIGVLLVLIFECFVSNYLTPKESEDQLKQIAPDMRGYSRRRSPGG